MRRFLAAAVLLLAACGERDRPGSPAVYDRIEAETDCPALQDEFDTAMAGAEGRRSGDDLRDASLAYAQAADRRMMKLGCFG